VGKHANVKHAYLIEDANDLKQSWFSDNPKIGITAGASTPEILVEGVLKKLEDFGITKVETMKGELETTTFNIPLDMFEHLSK